ncbi:hypothetical protein BDN70DRAFT_878037 [Pholiota conissans]|uniref:Uncharacterized protein n=1 Tax=Pholiota conissans TaxID=109636 RepID=A0A9P6CUW4_9AGAR|nr:hypothetical protein BDN70DRAFT_878037 [Pholiota conissans]
MSSLPTTSSAASTAASPTDASSMAASPHVVSSDSTTLMTPSMMSSGRVSQSDLLAVLPSYEEATATQDIARLPAYKRTHPKRYHPYRVDSPILSDGVGIDRYFNTIFDEEGIRIHVPPAPLRPPPTCHLVPTPLPLPVVNPNANETAYDFLNYRADEYPPDLAEFDRRVAHNVAAVILQEFVAAPSWGGRSGGTGNPQPTLPP